MKKYIKILLVLILLPVFLYSGLRVYQICSAYARAEAQYEELMQYVLPPVSSSAPHVVLPEAEELTGTSSVQPSVTQEEIPAVVPEPTTEILWPQVDFDALYTINPDIVGWLTIEDTGIHYPVVQGKNNDFYLTHQFDKSPSRAGCLFVDAANNAAFTDSNTIIYGHYTKDRSMFYELRGYKQQDFFDAHPTGWLVTPSAVYRLSFFSGYVSDIYGDAWNMDFSEQDYAVWLDTCKKKSMFVSDIMPEEDKKVLTLSTCSYEFENARFVLHAVLEEQALTASQSHKSK